MVSQRGNRFITKPFLDQLSQFINTSSREIADNRFVENINSRILKDVARARVAITTVCKLLCEMYVSNTKIDDADSDRLKQFFPLLINYIQPEVNSELHLFVLRQIVFDHGYRELDQVIQRSEYEWLNLQHANGNNEAQVKHFLYSSVLFFANFILTEK